MKICLCGCLLCLAVGCTLVPRPPEDRAVASPWSETNGLAMCATFWPTPAVPGDRLFLQIAVRNVSSNAFCIAKDLTRYPFGYVRTRGPKGEVPVSDVCCAPPPLYPKHFRNLFPGESAASRRCIGAVELGDPQQEDAPLALHAGSGSTQISAGVCTFSFVAHGFSCQFPDTWDRDSGWSVVEWEDRMDFPAWSGSITSESVKVEIGLKETQHLPAR